MNNNNKNLLNSVVTLVSAYVVGNRVSVEDLPKLIRDVHQALSAASAGRRPGAEPARSKPAAAPSRSVTREAIVCLEDGKAFRSLKRHLRVAHGLTPGEYRVKWGLRSDYPMTAPAFAAERSRLAKKAGLGKSRARGRRKGGRGDAGAELTNAA